MLTDCELLRLHLPNLVVAFSFQEQKGYCIFLALSWCKALIAFLAPHFCFFEGLLLVGLTNCEYWTFETAPTVSSGRNFVARPIGYCTYSIPSSGLNSCPPLLFCFCVFNFLGWGWHRAKGIVTILNLEWLLPYPFGLATISLESRF